MSDTSGGGDSGYAGQQGLTDAGSDFNKHSFLGDQAMGVVRTHIPVKIVKVHADSNGGPPTIDVQPLIKLQDGLGNTSSHGTIYGIPAHRHQAGDFAIISDPVKGDIGVMSISDRDISSLKENNGEESQPGSSRRFDLADGIYHGQILNKAPKHSLEVKRDSNGNVTSLNLTSPAGLNHNGVLIDKDGNIDAPGYIKAKGEVTAKSGGGSVSLSTHLHPGTGQPTPGT